MLLNGSHVLLVSFVTLNVATSFVGGSKLLLSITNVLFFAFKLVSLGRRNENNHTLEPLLTDTSSKQRTSIFVINVVRRDNPPYSGHHSTTDNDIDPTGSRYMEVSL